MRMVIQQVFRDLYHRNKLIFTNLRLALLSFKFFGNCNKWMIIPPLRSEVTAKAFHFCTWNTWNAVKRAHYQCIHFEWFKNCAFVGGVTMGVGKILFVHLLRGGAPDCVVAGVCSPPCNSVKAWRRGHTPPPLSRGEPHIPSLFLIIPTPTRAKQKLQLTLFPRSEERVDQRSEVGVSPLRHAPPTDKTVSAL